MKDGKAKPTDDLQIAMNPDEHGTVMRLNGRVSITSAPGLRDRLLARLRGQQPGSLTIDLSDVSYLDCAGIATLIEGLKVARNHQISLQLKGLHGNLHKLFQVTGLLALFETYGVNAPAASKVI